LSIGKSVNELGSLYMGNSITAWARVSTRRYRWNDPTWWINCHLRDQSQVSKSVL